MLIVASELTTDQNIFFTNIICKGGFRQKRCCGSHIFGTSFAISLTTPRKTAIVGPHEMDPAPIDPKGQADQAQLIH